MNPYEAEVFASADALISAFARHDSRAYFAAFAAYATFIFHNLDRTLSSRAEYEALWSQWEQEEGFKVLACHSRHRAVQVLGDVAIFTHAVETQMLMGGETLSNHERETIVFARGADGGWRAVHEHLSPQP
jgi:ketosteroid isomerase-like protein